MPAIESIVSQHAEEAAFLWLLRDAAVCAPHYSLAELARIAGEALSLITGLDLAHEDLEQDAPDDFAAGPSERPEDEEVAPDPDEDLPWPNPEAIQAWWEANGGRFRAGTHYLLGEPVNEAQCHHVLTTGKQRQRQAAALELALLRPEAPLFETRAPGFRQQRTGSG
ncbi:MAG: hypothetical protein LGR52_00030 [Candidatus Thiosymbion ectosymbiont of Robbea hypermnestra]|nr:hypothetical protein [Candidatus Thiosymbion ectosymbiont of Robbea hypermnestra]